MGEIEQKEKLLEEHFGKRKTDVRVETSLKDEKKMNLNQANKKARMYYQNL